METSAAVAALAALAQDNRLDIFRLLVRAGPDGMPAGRVAAALDLAPNTLTFHFDRLRLAGLVTVRREGRSMIYAARYEAMNALIAYLTENCCGGQGGCGPAGWGPVRQRRKARNHQARLCQVDARRPPREFRDLDERSHAGTRSPRHPGGKRRRVAGGL